MNAKELKSKLTTEHILTLMSDFGVEPLDGRNDNELKFRTICHGGESTKLYFYKDSQNFHCYTGCGSMDILQIIQNVMGYDLHKSIDYVAKRFGFHINFLEGFGATAEGLSEDWNILNKYKHKNLFEEKYKEFDIWEETYFRYFYPMAHRSFLNDGIDIGVMNRYEIMYDLSEDRVIIPHRNTNGDLVAIRCRNLDEELINTGRKYMPVIIKGKALSAPTSQYFYGLYHNQTYIKRIRKVVLVESEKAVMQMETMFPNENFALALSSSSIHTFQINILKDLGVEEIVVALDKEFDTIGSEEELRYRKRVERTILNRLKQAGFIVTIMWDTQNLLKRKQSPTDAGKAVFEKLFKHRFNHEILGG